VAALVFFSGEGRVCEQAAIAQSTEPKARAAALISFLPIWMRGKGA